MSVTPDAASATGSGPSPSKPVAGPAEPKADGGNQRVLEFIEKYALVMVFGGVLAFFSLWPRTSSKFATRANFENVLGNQAVIGVLAMAIIIPLVCNEFDFSVGPMAGLTQMLCAGFMFHNGFPLWLAILVPVLIGSFIGLSTGNTVARIGVNSLIVTLGLATVLFGIVEWYSGGKSIISGISQTLIDLGTGNWFGIPRTIYYLAAVALGVYYLLEHTPAGRYLQSIGSNRDAARLVGLPVERYIMLAFVISGALAGLAGVLMVARNGLAQPLLGTVGDTLRALAAAFLGATAIKPGRFNVLGTLVAIFFLAFTINGLNLAEVGNWVNDVFNGVALFVAVLISTVVGRHRAGVT